MSEVQSTLRITTLGRASEKCPYSRSVVIPEVSLHVYRWNELCSGHGNSVVVRELSLYPQSLLAKLTVTWCSTAATEFLIFCLPFCCPKNMRFLHNYINSHSNASISNISDAVCRLDSDVKRDGALCLTCIKVFFNYWWFCRGRHAVCNSYWRWDCIRCRGICPVNRLHLCSEEALQVGTSYWFLVYIRVACVLFSLDLFGKVLLERSVSQEHRTLISQTGKMIIVWQSATKCPKCENLSEVGTPFLKQVFVWRSCPLGEISTHCVQCTESC